MKTFWYARGSVNFDVNILGELGVVNEHRAAWILVGGRSSRMGIDKARAESNGRAMALRVADRARAVCDEVSLIGDPAVYAELGLRVIPDNFPGQGPLAGIEAALLATDKDANLIIACDMPAIGENLLEELFEAPFEPRADCVVPQHADGRLEPLCAVYRKSCHIAVKSMLESGIRGVTEAIRLFESHSVAVRYLRVSGATEFANLNTPEDWRKYHNG
jgi:molybdopterin-guanine dinucleotide biosynthesis protein A